MGWGVKVHKWGGRGFGPPPNEKRVGDLLASGAQGKVVEELVEAKEISKIFQRANLSLS